ncbi:unnamed protein product [Orchesella dallaii]|uniref:Uncharacterized protein n=1 Tax=Orchesella dallaii TaxID=48710 RepID=A0ABP1PL83_9HEXA
MKIPNVKLSFSSNQAMDVTQLPVCSLVSLLPIFSKIPFTFSNLTDDEEASCKLQERKQLCAAASSKGKKEMVAMGFDLI